MPATSAAAAAASDKREMSNARGSVVAIAHVCVCALPHLEEYACWQTFDPQPRGELRVLIGVHLRRVQGRASHKVPMAATQGGHRAHRRAMMGEAKTNYAVERQRTTTHDNLHFREQKRVLTPH